MALATGHRWRSLCLAMAATCALVACAGGSSTRSLYEQLGGTSGIEAIVDGMLLRMSDDDSINHFFASTDIVRFRGLLVEQFCAEADGPCRYSGFPMHEAHANRHITEAHFNAVVEHLVESMEEQSVPVPAQNRLLARLARLRGGVIRR